MNGLVAMPRYEAYKDSGVEWLGEIPRSWVTLRFTYQFDLSKGLTITKDNLKDSGIPCVNYGEIHSKYGFELVPEKHPLKYVSDDYLNSSIKSLLSHGDFVFADTSEDIEGSGNFTYLNSDMKVFAGYHTIIARPKKEDCRFLAYVCESLSFRSQIRQKVKGVKVYSITKSILNKTFVWFPEKSEQTTIANFLDKKTAQIDQAIAIKQQQIERLKERKQILIQKAVTQGLDSNVSMRDSGVEWIGEIPEHWGLVRLKRVVKLLQTGPFGTELHAHDYVSNGTPLINPKHMKKDQLLPEKNCSVDSKTVNKLSKYQLKTGDLVMARRGELGRCAVISKKENGWLCGTGSLIVRLKINRFDINYFFKLISGKGVSEMLSLESIGSTMDNLNTTILGRLFLPCPPISEQKKITKYLELQSSKINQAITLQQSQIEKLKEYKTTLINSAVTGKIKISGILHQMEK